MMTSHADTVNLVAVGDLMLSNNRGTGRKIKEFGPEYPFLHVRQYLQDADIVIGNLEGPISTRGRNFAKQDPQMTFRASPETVKGLVSSNFTIVSLANNHTNDYGDEALIDTMDALNENGIKYIGAGRDSDEAHEGIVLEVNGVRIAFLAYCVFMNFKTNPATKKGCGISQFIRKEALVDIKKAGKKADITVVSMHWGLDFTEYPVPIQMGYAREMLDAGAHLILGHHSHLLQGLEKKGNKMIFYSLGDFVFDEPGQDTAIYKFSISKDGIKGYEFIPAKLNNEFQPELQDGDEAKRIIMKMEHLTKAYSRYDPEIRKNIIDSYIFFNLYVFIKSLNFNTLKNLSSIEMISKTIGYLVRKTIKLFNIC
jgi:hypothetical protein